MGPPKKLPKKLLYSEIQNQYDLFIYQWDDSSQSYYLFNPYTGETILHSDYNNVDRSLSYWKPIDKHVLTKNVQTIMLYKQQYASRLNGFRSYIRYTDVNEAATVISAVVRGFIARLSLRKYYHNRYYKILHTNTGYYYYQDNYNENNETSWYKPLLAFPDDIPVYSANDSEDYMKGDKYSYRSCLNGPYIRLSKVGKSNKIRAKHDAFIPNNPFREAAVSRHEDIDLENFTIGSVISWLEDFKVVPIQLDEYAIIRAAECKNDWANILKYMRKDIDNLQLQLYGFYAFSKSSVPIDSSGLLTTEAVDAMYLCMSYIEDRDNKYSQTLKLFVYYALNNILSTTAGRAEYFNVMTIQEIGEARNIAIEQFITSRIIIFNKYLTKIPIELHAVPTDLPNVFTDVKKPTRRGAELVEQSLSCLSSLANNNEHREQMAYVTAAASIFAIKLCEEESNVMLQGLKYLYNLCYRCESGQEILRHRNIKPIIISAHSLHGSDKDIMYQCHRLELAMKKDGWRGYIEEIITKEMFGESIDPMYNQNIDENEIEDDNDSRIERMNQFYVNKKTESSNNSKNNDINNNNSKRSSKSSSSDEDLIFS